jgi:hypothetical protein
MTGHFATLTIDGKTIPLKSWTIDAQADAIKAKIIQGFGIPPSVVGEAGSMNWSSGAASEAAFKSAIDARCEAVAAEVFNATLMELVLRLEAREIERRLPRDFVQGRDKLARALAESELEFQKQLDAWDRKHNGRRLA